MTESTSTTQVGIATGAGSGMGAACAARLADQVDHLLLVDRNDNAAAVTAKRIGTNHRAKIETAPVDITDIDALERLAARVTELGSLRSVAHAAGISPSMADWRAVLSVDFVGTALLLRALDPLFTTGSAIVCFASIAPLLAADFIDIAGDRVLDEPLVPDLLDRLRNAVGPTIEDPGMAYVWAKRGVLRLVQRQAVPLGRRGARICSVSPGIIDTPMGRQEYDAQTMNAVLVERTPLGREGQPDEVAATVAFLLSAEASFINGIDVLVDGGVIAAIRTTGFAEP